MHTSDSAKSGNIEPEINKKGRDKSKYSCARDKWLNIFLYDVYIAKKKI